MRPVLACHAHLVFLDAPAPPPRAVRPLRPSAPVDAEPARHELRLPDPSLLPGKLAIVLAALLPLVLG